MMKKCKLFFAALVATLSLLTSPLHGAVNSENEAIANVTKATENRLALNELFTRLAKSTEKQQADLIAVEIWQRWFNTDNKRVNAMLQGVLKLRRESNLKQALILSDRIVAQYPAYSEGWNQRATLFFMLGDFQASLADIDQTLLREPRHFGALSGRASIYAIQGHKEKAKQAIEQALSFNPFINADSILNHQS